MKKIKKIHKIKLPKKIFKDFAWPTALPEFKDKNLIYGWNGSGKTTLSNLFRAIEKSQDIADGEVTFLIDTTNVQENQLSTASLPEVRVFNRDFVAENVFRADGNVSPIYVLGEENVERQKRLEELKEGIEIKRADKDKLIEQKTEAFNRADGIAKTTANDVIKPTLSSQGTNLYNNYDKRKFDTKYNEFCGNAAEVKTKILDQSSLNTMQSSN